MNLTITITTTTNNLQRENRLNTGQWMALTQEPFTSNETQDNKKSIL
jgi:hypothetical protein